MTNTTLREDFEKNFSVITVNKVIMSADGWYQSTLEDVFKFIELKVKEGEVRGYARCKEEKEQEEAGEGW